MNGSSIQAKNRKISSTRYLQSWKWLEIHQGHTRIVLPCYFFQRLLICTSTFTFIHYYCNGTWLHLMWSWSHWDSENETNPLQSHEQDSPLQSPCPPLRKVGWWDPAPEGYGSISVSACGYLCLMPPWHCYWNIAPSINTPDLKPLRHHMNTWCILGHSLF